MYESTPVDDSEPDYQAKSHVFKLPVKPTDPTFHSEGEGFLFQIWNWI